MIVLGPQRSIDVATLGHFGRALPGVPATLQVSSYFMLLLHVCGTGPDKELVVLVGMKQLPVTLRLSAQRPKLLVD